LQSLTGVHSPIEIKAVALDVDGVLTDGTFLWDAHGSEQKKFHFRDVMGISRASKRGIRFALISGERNGIVDRIARKFGITDIHQGCSDKAAALISFSEKSGIPLNQIAFMGDDINDLEVLRIAGLSAAPADAHSSVLAIARFISVKNGGCGAVRDFLDHLGFV
jgi:3-deoxy-D-manno-octulosonate 8-phosphate phosphatase (KDO 8-P phosphatase)